MEIQRVTTSKINFGNKQYGKTYQPECKIQYKAIIGKEVNKDIGETDQKAQKYPSTYGNMTNDRGGKCRSVKKDAKERTINKGE